MPALAHCIEPTLPNLVLLPVEYFLQELNKKAAGCSASLLFTDSHLRESP